MRAPRPLKDPALAAKKANLLQPLPGPGPGEAIGTGHGRARIALPKRSANVGPALPKRPQDLI